MKTVFLILSCMVLTCTAAFSESRTWTNNLGKTLEGEFVKATDKEVSVKLNSGKTVKLPLASLSEDDQAFIKQVVEENQAKETAEAAEEQKSKLSFKWSKKMDSALKDAQEYDLPVLVLFTGAKWCGWCVKLEEEVLSKTEFKRLAGGKMLGVKYECPSPGEYSAEGKKKAKEFGIRGVPHYVILDKDGKKIGDGGYNAGISPQSLVDKVTKCAAK